MKCKAAKIKMIKENHHSVFMNRNDAIVKTNQKKNLKQIYKMRYLVSLISNNHSLSIHRQHLTGKLKMFQSSIITTL